MISKKKMMIFALLFLFHLAYSSTIHQEDKNSYPDPAAADMEDFHALFMDWVGAHGYKSHSNSVSWVIFENELIIVFDWLNSII